MWIVIRVYASYVRNILHYVCIAPWETRIDRENLLEFVIDLLQQKHCRHLCSRIKRTLERLVSICSHSYSEGLKFSKHEQKSEKQIFVFAEEYWQWTEIFC